MEYQRVLTKKKVLDVHVSNDFLSSYYLEISFLV